MRIFVTGATGFIGSAVIHQLIGAGHRVLGLARSEKSAASLDAAGVEVHRGSLEDPASLKSAAAACDGVIHTGYIHDFSNIAASGVIDVAAVEAMGDALAGTGKPLVVTSAIAVLPQGRMATEADAGVPNTPGAHRLAAEVATLAQAKRGVRSSVIRLPPSVHGEGDYGFVPMLIQIAREKGVSAFIGAGSNRWPAVHRFDAATLYRLAAENGIAGSVYHAMDDEGVPTRAIAEAIGHGLGLPVKSVAAPEAAAHFGWFAKFMALDNPASSQRTRHELGWTPRHSNLLEDLAAGHYFTK